MRTISNQKYEITDIAHEEYPFLHRIRALRDICGEIRAGDIGGFVESESNLSAEPGDCAWIFDDAIAAGDAYVDHPAFGIPLLGRWLVVKIRFLSDFNIPEPVAGGLLAGIVVFALNALFGLTFKFQGQLQTAFMLMFFSSIGLSADFSRLRAGGKPLVIFLFVVAAFIMVQNLVGVGMAAALGLQPLIGLVTGSITLTGGHGTAGAWGPVLESRYGISGATTLGIATATFGLVAGGLIGGPVAKYLIRKLDRHKLPQPTRQTKVEAVAASQSLYSTRHTEGDTAPDNAMFDKPDEIRLITASSTIETLALFAGCMAFAGVMTTVAKGTVFELPTFVWALGGGVIIRNVLTHFFKFDMFDRAIDVFGNASLSLFLAMALLSLRLWELTSLALPVMVILAVQVCVMIKATLSY